MPDVKQHSAHSPISSAGRNTPAFRRASQAGGEGAQGQQAALPSKIIVYQILPSGDCATPVPNFV